MAAPPDTQDLRALAIAWLWSRPSSMQADAPVDLETLDQWRQGLLTPTRADLVKRQLGNDPRLLRMLEELVAADELLRQEAAEELAAEPRPRVWERVRQSAGEARSYWEHVRQSAGEALSYLLDPWWAGGLVAVTAALLLVVMLGPVLVAPDLNHQLDDVYAALDAPPDELTLPWGPKIAMRGAPKTDPDAEVTEPRRLAKRAFQAGMVDGIELLEARYPELDWNPGNQLHSALPDCAAGDETCEQLVNLGRATGSWALAAYLQCRASPASGQLMALGLLSDLQAAWGALPGGHPLGDDVKAIVADQNPCKSLEDLLRTWGR